jgi:hypothetical protein
MAKNQRNQEREFYLEPVEAMDPGPFDQYALDMRYAIRRIQGHAAQDRNDTSAETRARIRTAIEGLQGAVKNAYLEEVEEAQLLHRDKQISFRNMLRAEESAYDHRVDSYHRRLESYQKKKEKYREQVIKLNELIRKYFSDTVMKKTHELIPEGKFQEALEEVTKCIYNGTPEEGTYLRNVLEHVKFNMGMSFEAFNIIVEDIFTMAHLCGSTYTEYDKLSIIHRMIQGGNCRAMHTTINLTKYNKLNYEKTIEKLLKTYQDVELTRTSAYVARPESARSAITSDKAKCTVCGKYHKGPHIDNYNPKTHRNDKKGKEEAKNTSSEKADEAKAATTTIMMSPEEKALFEEFKRRPQKPQAHQAQHTYMDDEYAGVAKEVTLTASTETGAQSKVCSDAGASSTMTPDI